MAKNRMNTIVVDFVIVYLRIIRVPDIKKCITPNKPKITYNEMVTSPRPQLEKPMSMPLAIPVGDIVCMDVRQSMLMRDLPVTKR